MIRELLAEAGHGAGQGDAPGQRDRRLADRDDAGDLPRRRPRRTLHQPALSPGRTDFTAAERPACRTNSPTAASGGSTLESATAEGGARLDLNFGARRVYLVLGSPGKPRRVRVLLDGKPIAAADAGADVHDGVVTVTAQRLYNLVDLPKVEHHVLDLYPEAGVMGYAFTFG